VSFDAWPWRIERLGFETDEMAILGEGTFDPLAGAVDLDLTARLAREVSADLVRRVDELELLLDRDGRMTLPLEVGGALTAPAIRVDLVRALRERVGGPHDRSRAELERTARERLEALAREKLGETAEPGEDGVRGLVRGLLDRKKKDKDDGGRP
jgi:hypothetical protein